MATAGALRERVRFQRRPNEDDGFGNPQSGEFTDVHECAARIMPKLGSETVLASRLSGIQPFLVTVRMCSVLADLAADWRLVDARNSDRVFNIKSFSNPDEHRQYLELLVEQGTAT